MRIGRWAACVLASVVLAPRSAAASPEAFLVIGGGGDIAAEAFTPEGGATALHEGDRVPLPSCDAPLRFGLRRSADAAKNTEILLRVVKKRLARGCALDVLALGTSGRGATVELPCGTLLVEIRASGRRGRVRSSAGADPNGPCSDADRELQGPLGVRLLDEPGSGASDRNRH